MFKVVVEMKYVIVQAGGRGSRLEKYTYNKPKALLSVDSFPMIFNTFELFKDSIVCGDRRLQVRCFEEISGEFSDVNYVLIKANWYWNVRWYR